MDIFLAKLLKEVLHFSQTHNIKKIQNSTVVTTEHNDNQIPASVIYATNIYASTIKGIIT